MHFIVLIVIHMQHANKSDFFNLYTLLLTCTVCVRNDADSGICICHISLILSDTSTF